MQPSQQCVQYARVRRGDSQQNPMGSTSARLESVVRCDQPSLVLQEYALQVQRSVASGDQRVDTSVHPVVVASLGSTGLVPRTYRGLGTLASARFQVHQCV